MADDDYMIDILMMVQQNDQAGILRRMVGVIVLVVLVTAVSLALVKLFLARAYMQVRGSQSRGIGLKLGSNEPPLFQMAREEVSVAKVAFLRFWRLWPILVTLVLAPVAVSAAAELYLIRLQGREAPIAGVLLLWTLRLLMLGFALWAIYKVIRLYAYLVPVAVDDGTVDLPAVKALAPAEPLLVAVLTATFWKHVLIIVLACLPAYLLGVLFDGLLDLLGAEQRGLVLNFLSFSLRHVGYIIGAVFFVGALGVMLSGRVPPPAPPGTAPAA